MRLTAIATITFTAFATTAGATSLSDLFSSYVALGDSLTDDGKLQQQVPPSVGGRFSNGLTYAEIVAQDFAVSANLALGGATAEDDNDNEANFVGPAEALYDAFGTFNNQVDTLTAQVAGPLGAALGDNPLVSVFFGANDLLQDLGDALGGVEVGRNAANAVKAGIERIAALDSKFDDILLLNLPNLANTPRFSDPANIESAFAPLASQETAAFNARLFEIAGELEDDGLNVYLLDVDQIFQDILSGAVDLGVSNLTGRCIPDFQNFDPSDNCSLTGFELGPDGMSLVPVFDVTLADDFLFVDTIHPNRVAHSFLAEAIPAVVPLPAGLPLLLAGLGSLIVLRRRKRA